MAILQQREIPDISDIISGKHDLELKPVYRYPGVWRITKDSLNLAYFKDSQKLNFIYISQFKRLLSLEYCLQVLDSIRYNNR